MPSMPGIMQDQIDLLLSADLQSLAAVGRRQDVISVGLQIDFQRRNDIPFIVADQYMAHAPHLLHLSYRMKDEDTMGKNIKI